MRAETHEKPRKLRYGYTTGACATATSLAAASLLFDSSLSLKTIEITLPKGQHVNFELEYCKPSLQGAIAATCKDAGDDPDVTHRAIIISEVKLKPEQGIQFFCR